MGWLAAALVAACLTACNVQRPHPTSVNVVRWSSQADALSFDPHAQNEITSITMLQQVYEPLVRRDPDMRITPALAESWSRVEPTLWEFNLRHNVRFHDGEPFTADDVVFSLRRAKSARSQMKTFIEDVSRIYEVDPYRVRLKTREPMAILPQDLVNIFIMPKAWSERNHLTEVQDFASGQENFANRHANGTGPFRLTTRLPGIHTLMSRNIDWWGGRLYGNDVREIDYRPIASASTRVAALLSGELDFLLDPPVQDLDRIRNTFGLKVESTTESRTIFLGMDQSSRVLRTAPKLDRNPFADLRVRKAIYEAIDVAAIDRSLMWGQAVPAGMLAPPLVEGYSRQLDVRLPYNPTASRALLSQAGYAQGFNVTLDCPNNRYMKDEEICVAIAGMLARIGVRVMVNAQPKNIWGSKVQNHATDFYLHGWGVATLDSENIFTYLFHSGAPWNSSGYSNNQVDNLIDMIKREPDPTRRRLLIDRCWRQIDTDVAYIPIHYPIISWAMSNKLDIAIMPDNAPRFFFAHIRQR